MKKYSQERHHEQRLFQKTAWDAAHNPLYTGPVVDRRERKQLTSNPLKQNFSPDEQAYLRAHKLRREAHDATKALARKEIAQWIGPSPSDKDEVLWSSQQAWANHAHDLLKQEIAGPRFAQHLSLEVGRRTGGQWFHPAAESFLARQEQPHLYARVGVLALAREFGDRQFHNSEVDNVLGLSLRRDYADQVVDLLVHDQVLKPDSFYLSVDMDAAHHLSQQPVYLPPRVVLPQVSPNQYH
ncbi:MAG TPA: hypothetical protein VF733_03340 [Candidatus Saccharimonadales bacterium]